MSFQSCPRRAGPASAKPATTPVPISVATSIVERWVSIARRRRSAQATGSSCASTSVGTIPAYACCQPRTCSPAMASASSTLADRTATAASFLIRAL